MQVLKVHDSGLTDLALAAVARGCQQLAYLSMQGPPLRGPIRPGATHQQPLSLEGNITDSGLKAIAVHCTMLTSLLITSELPISSMIWHWNSNWFHKLACARLCSLHYSAMHLSHLLQAHVVTLACIATPPSWPELACSSGAARTSWWQCGLVLDCGHMALLETVLPSSFCSM